jgi:hypothetical protein
MSTDQPQQVIRPTPEQVAGSINRLNAVLEQAGNADTPVLVNPGDLAIALGLLYGFLQLQQEGDR